LVGGLILKEWSKLENRSRELPGTLQYTGEKRERAGRGKGGDEEATSLLKGSRSKKKRVDCQTEGKSEEGKSLVHQQ